jgi:hypothetical protein
MIDEKKWYNIKGWLCDNCHSSNITKLHPENEEDLFCLDCKRRGYQVSEWFIMRNNKKVRVIA